MRATVSFTEAGKPGTFAKYKGMFPKAVISGKHLPSTNHTEQKRKIKLTINMELECFLDLYTQGTVLCIEHTRKFK